ncbi:MULTISPECIES: GDSL-type esterase/lipase family protein [unclassified Helicobacter]|uniref:GDSL-type esterase/lipase family protein n=1 Tax=unclassified Helicobacter TaxID=2593540 RepID=UPI000CF0FCC2|nr:MULTISPECIES: GDSL-type esterase/lipase family protein [unclassified Helicobacter]
MKKLILAVCLLPIWLGSKTGSLFEQNLQKYDPKIIKKIEKAQMHNYNSPNVNLLRDKILKKENLKIKVFGDSHIAPDIFSSELRNIIFTPNALGFIYPLFPNYHRNILVEMQSKGFETYNSLRNNYINYPMGGVIARSKNSDAYIIINPKFENKNFTTRFVFKSPNNLATFEILDANQKKIHLSSKNPETWVLSKEYDLKFPIKIKSLIRNGMLGGYFIYNKDKNNIIDHMGINGARSDLWLKWNQEIFDQELQAIQYDLIIFSYGSNDAISEKFDKESFLHNYKVLIRKIRKFNPNATILLVGPPTVVLKNNEKKKYEITTNFLPVKKAVRELAKNENTLFFDLDDFMEKSGTKDEWIEKKLSKKDVHLTPLGYRLSAIALYKALLDVLKIKE